MNARIFSKLEPFRKGLRQDLLASIVVFLVALPLAMGIAIASGVPPAAALLTCIIGGIIVGAISGSPLQASGPAAGLSVIVYEIVQQHGIEKLGVVILIAGMVQAAAGVLKLGQWFRAVSPAVVNGMLSGIGVLIFASQFHVMLDDSPRSSGLNNLLAIPEAFVSVWEQDLHNPHIAGSIGVLTIICILVWEYQPIKKIKLIPSALIAVVVATIVTTVLELPIKHVELPDNLFQVIRLPNWGDLKSLTLIAEGLGLALVASAETLLSASAVDRMQTKYRTKYDRELFAQGVGNCICGIVGALPMTGVIVRSTVNIQAGAQTRLSTMMHGTWILILVVTFPTLLRVIPTATLAALLVYTGYKLMNFKIVKELWKFGRSEVLIYFITLGTIVATDLLTGVLTGVALTIAKLLYMFSHLEIRRETINEDQTVLHLKGAATFLNLPRLAETLESVPPNSELHVHFEELDYIDHASLDLVMAWEQQHKATGGSLVIDWGTLGSMFRDRRRTPRKPDPVVPLVDPGTPAQTDPASERQCCIHPGEECTPDHDGNAASADASGVKTKVPQPSLTEPGSTEPAPTEPAQTAADGSGAVSKTLSEEVAK